MRILPLCVRHNPKKRWLRQELEAIRTALDQRLLAIRNDNAARLEQMGVTVDEKLQSTLETRLGESFRLVSERLEWVHKGLGEMQSLAAGVGDLKRVLGNVTTRGAWGEVQLENLLTQMLAPDQFKRNVASTRSGEVWKTLCEVKIEFRKYSEVLAQIRTRLEQAVETVDKAAVRTRAIERRLKSVESDDDPDGEEVLRLTSAG